MCTAGVTLTLALPAREARVIREAGVLRYENFSAICVK